MSTEMVVQNGSNQPVPKRFTKRQEMLEGAKQFATGRVGYKLFGEIALLVILIVAELYFLFVAFTMLASNPVTLIAAVVGSLINAFGTWYVFRAKIYSIPQKSVQSKIAIGLLVLDGVVIALNTWLATMIASAGVTNTPLEVALAGNWFLQFWHEACTSAPLIIGIIGWPAMLLSDPDKKRRDYRLKAENERQNLILDAEMSQAESDARLKELQIEINEIEEAAKLERLKLDKEAEVERLKIALEAELERKKQEALNNKQLSVAQMERERVEANLKHQTKLQEIEQQKEMNKEILALRKDALDINIRQIRRLIAQYTPYLNESAEEVVRQTMESITGKHIPVSIQARQMIIDAQKPKITAKLPDLQKEEVQSLTTDSSNNALQSKVEGHSDHSPDDSISSQASSGRKSNPPIPIRERLKPGRNPGTKNGSTIKRELEQQEATRRLKSAR